MPLRIILADDHQIVRQGVKALLQQEGFDVVGEAANGVEAIQLAKELRPDVAILDLSMPLINGANAAREILRDFPEMKVILLTMHTEEAYVLDALQAGVTGYVVKSEAASDLVRALKEVCGGATYLSAKVSRAIVRNYLEKSAPPRAPDPQRASGPSAHCRRKDNEGNRFSLENQCEDRGFPPDEHYEQAGDAWDRGACPLCNPAWLDRGLKPPPPTALSIGGVGATRLVRLCRANKHSQGVLLGHFVVRGFLPWKPVIYPMALGETAV